jgi:hypothetical protein
MRSGNLLWEHAHPPTGLLSKAISRPTGAIQIVANAPKMQG